MDGRRRKIYQVSSFTKRPTKGKQNPRKDRGKSIIWNGNISRCVLFKHQTIHLVYLHTEMTERHFYVDNYLIFLFFCFSVFLFFFFLFFFFFSRPYNKEGEVQ